MVKELGLTHILTSDDGKLFLIDNELDANEQDSSRKHPKDLQYLSDVDRVTNEETNNKSGTSGKTIKDLLEVE